MNILEYYETVSVAVASFSFYFKAIIERVMLLSNQLPRLVSISSCFYYFYLLLIMVER